MVSPLRAVGRQTLIGYLLEGWENFDGLENDEFRRVCSSHPRLLLSAGRLAGNFRAQDTQISRSAQEGKLLTEKKMATV